MALHFDFVVDRVVHGKIYPHLTQWQAQPYTQEWRQFGHHWPYTIPLRIEEYCAANAVHINCGTWDSGPKKWFYPIALNFFAFDIDYFALLPDHIGQAVKASKLQLLFFYHEGDNPARIALRLNQLAEQHQLPHNCYVFVSGNSAADQLRNFVYFCDFELWFQFRNTVPPVAKRGQPSRDFVLLNRLHKSWRATLTADLLPVLENSIWSYCETGMLNDDDNPLEIDSVPGLRDATNKFLCDAPYTVDDLSQSQRNSHDITVDKFFNDAWMHIVVETHWDADQSGGAFLTEKTFKPIKNFQPFFIAGCAGSLQALRNLGYRTFDGVLDNSYDSILDNTQRWRRLKHSIESVKHCLPEIYQACWSDMQHNQQLFLGNKTQRLNTLIKNIYEKSQ